MSEGRKAQELREFAEAIIRNDATPTYAYSEARLSDGEEPAAGERWATPAELARDFLKSLAAPVPVERPDEERGGSYADASPLRKRASDALKGFRGEADDPLGRLALADRVLLAARLPEQPDEGEVAELRFDAEVVVAELQEDLAREHDLLLKERDPEYPGSLAFQLRAVAARLPADEGDEGLRPVMLCKLCRSGAGGECHMPGCALYLNRAPDLPVAACPTVPEEEPDAA